MRNYEFSQLLHANGPNFTIKRTITNHKHMPSNVLLLLLFWVHCRIAVLSMICLCYANFQPIENHIVQENPIVSSQNPAVTFWLDEVAQWIYTTYTFCVRQFTVTEAIHSTHYTHVHHDGRQSVLP